MARINPLMVLPPALFLVFIAMAGIGMYRDDRDALPSARIGQPVPPLQLTAMEGKDLTDALSEQQRRVPE